MPEVMTVVEVMAVLEILAVVETCAWLKYWLCLRNLLKY